MRCNTKYWARVFNIRITKIQSIEIHTGLEGWRAGKMSYREMSGTLLKSSKRSRGIWFQCQKPYTSFLKDSIHQISKGFLTEKKKEWKLKAKTSQQEIWPNHLQWIWANKLYKEMVGSHLLKRLADAVSCIQTRHLPVCRSHSVKYDGSVMTKCRGETNIAPLHHTVCNCKANQSMPSTLFSLGNCQCWLPNSMLLFIYLFFFIMIGPTVQDTTW